MYRKQFSTIIIRQPRSSSKILYGNRRLRSCFVIAIAYRDARFRFLRFLSATNGVYMSIYRKRTAFVYNQIGLDDVSTVNFLVKGHPFYLFHDRNNCRQTINIYIFPFFCKKR
jgi:hypothetical protein